MDWRKGNFLSIWYNFIKVSLINLLGQSIDIIYEGEISQGEKNVFLHAENYPKGVYFVEIKTESNTVFQKLIIRWFKSDFFLLKCD